MTLIEGQDVSTIRIEVDGHMIATAEVHRTDRPGVVHSDLHADSGPLPRGTRTRLVDAVLDHPEVHHARSLLATMPLGDTEMLQRVRQRCTVVETRPTGATKIVEVSLGPDRD